MLKNKGNSGIISSVINMVKAVLFDLDGTLADTLTDLATSANYALAHFGFPTHETEKYKYFVGNGMSVLVSRILPEDKRDDKTHATVKKVFLSHYGAHYADNTRAYSGVPEVVAALKEKGIKVAVVTNKAHEAAIKVLEKLYPNTFDVICGQRDGIPTKPAPDMPLSVMAKLGVKPEECAFVGDSGPDAATGVNCGATPIGVLWGFRTADELRENGAKYLAATPEELLSVILSL